VIFEGRVVNTYTREEVPGATIRVNGYSTMTDERGYFSLDIPEGKYSVSVSKSGFEPATESLSLLTATRRTFLLKPVFRAL